MLFPLHSQHFKTIYLFIFGWARSSLLHAGFLQLQWAGTPLSCGAQSSHHGSFSCGRAQALGRASVVTAHRLSSCDLQALEHRLNSCCTILPTVIPKAMLFLMIHLQYLFWILSWVCHKSHEKITFFTSFTLYLWNMHTHAHTLYINQLHHSLFACITA